MRPNTIFILSYDISVFCLLVYISKEACNIGVKLGIRKTVLSFLLEVLILQRMVEQINGWRDYYSRAIDLMNSFNGYIGLSRACGQNNASARSCLLPGVQSLSLIVVRLAPVEQRVIQWLPAWDSVVRNVLAQPGKDLMIAICFRPPLAMTPQKNSWQIRLFSGSAFQYDRASIKINSFAHLFNLA
jgi:hypothetical protein